MTNENINVKIDEQELDNVVGGSYFPGDNLHAYAMHDDGRHHFTYTPSSGSDRCALCGQTKSGVFHTILQPNLIYSMTVCDACYGSLSK